MKFEVKGHSGCQIDVAREDGVLYVYKSSRDSKYLGRLVKQAQKQKLASIPKLQNIRVPKVHAIDTFDDMVRVKMDYVYSKNFVEFFENAGFEQVGYLIDAIKMYIEREIDESPITQININVIIDKFQDVVKHVESNSNISNDPEILDILKSSKTIFESMNDLFIPVGVCHGDLTFSNILFNGNNYYLIDFLDSFIESPLLDIVKIRQDTAWLWSQLMYVKPCDTVRLKIAFGKIDRILDRHFASRYDWYREYYGPLQLMNFLRILQYASECKVIDYLKNVIYEQLQTIQSDCACSFR